MSDFADDSECRECLESLQKDFENYLLNKVSPRTVRKHIAIVSLFIDFLCFDCALKRLDDITVGMANSLFRKWYLSKISDATESELKATIKKFFIFLATEKHIRNEKVLQRLHKK